MLVKESFKTLLAAGAIALVAGGASAATFDLTFTSNGAPPPGVNDCAGDFGTPPDCVYVSADSYYFGDPLNVAAAAYDSNDYGSLSLLAKVDNPFAETPTVTPGPLSGGTFTFEVVEGLLKWTYNPGASLATVLAFSVKGGPNYNVWEIDSAPTNSGGVQTFSGWFSPQGSSTDAISHISFFGAPAPVPLPAAGFLMIGALGGLAALRRSRKAA